MANLPSRTHDLAIRKDKRHELSAAKAACAPWGAFAAAMPLCPTVRPYMWFVGVAAISVSSPKKQKCRPEAVF